MFFGSSGKDRNNEVKERHLKVFSSGSQSVRSSLAPKTFMDLTNLSSPEDERFACTHIYFIVFTYIVAE